MVRPRITVKLGFEWPDLNEDQLRRDLLRASFP